MPDWIERAGIADAGARAQAQLLHSILVGAFALNLVSFALVAPVATNQAYNILGHLIAALTYAAAIVAVRRGHVRTTAHIVVGLLLSLTVGMGFVTGGLASTAPVVAIAVMVMAYYLLGLQAGAFATGVLVFAVVAMAVSAPWLPEWPAPTGMANLPGFLLATGMISFTLYSSISRSERYAGDARSALEGRDAAEARQRHVLATMREGVLGVAANREITSANPAAVRLLGQSEAALVGQSLDAVLVRVGAGGVPTLTGTERMEIRIRPNADGPAIPVQLSMSFGVRGDVVCVLADITETKAAQKAQRDAIRAAEEASRAKSQFLANMSHELRTPLNAILGYSEMLAEEFEDRALLDDVERIHSAGKHLLGLINDVLDLSKIEAGRMELVRERIDLGELVRDVARTSQPLAAATGATLTVEVDEAIGTAFTDAQRLRQVLLNLTSNACKFSRQASVTLRATRETGGPRHMLVFAVEDTGIGISAEHLPRLFQPFTQADASTSREYGGTGLGLVLSRRFTEMLGGEIDVVSAEGEGSTFTVRIPADASSLTSAPPTRVAKDPDLPAVLCIDDDPSVLDLLSRMLDTAGFRAIVASDGERGLELARAHHPVAITLDIRLPGMDGWEVLGALKADPELARIPVVIATVVDEERRGYVMGAADYLVKPIARDRLVDALAAVSRQTGRVLVVEDDDDTRSVLVRRLVDAGWKVQEAADGSVAMEWLQTTSALPDVILLDMMMPVMDGFEVAEQLRASPTLRAIPVVVLTALDLSASDRARLDGAIERAFTKSQVDLREVIAEVQRLAAPA